MNGAATSGQQHTTTPLCDAERRRTPRSRRERVETVIRARGRRARGDDGAREAVRAAVFRSGGAFWCSVVLQQSWLM